MGRETVLEEFTVGCVANDEQLKMMKSHTIELLMQFIASSPLSFRRAGGGGGWSLCKFCWYFGGGVGADRWCRPSRDEA
jgi:hypothetical protein